ncbi:MAG: hypothetical protein ACX930_13825 [Erythrobacter sp.]
MRNRTLDLCVLSAALVASPSLAQSSAATGEVEATATREAIEAVQQNEELDPVTGLPRRTSEVPDEVEAEDGLVPPSFYVVAASDRFLSTYPGTQWLESDLEICVEEGETVVLAQQQRVIERLELRGPVCTLVAEAEAVASVVVARTDEFSPRTARARTGATRGGSRLNFRGSVENATLFRVASGSDAVLERFPRGTSLTRATEICLERGEQVTLISNRGQRVTYRGPGCARRVTAPGGTNVGGFTFGWNAHALQEPTVRLP